MTSDPKPVLNVTDTNGPQTVQTVQALLSELWRYKWLIPAVAAIVTAATAFWVVRQPKSYEAAALLEYDPRPVQPLGRAVEDTAAGQVNYWETQEFYETQNFVLRSRSLAERVVRKLALQRDSAFMGIAEEQKKAFDSSPIEQATSQLQGRIEVQQIRDTRLVRVIVHDGDPDRAQLLANAVADAYIEKSLEDRLGTSGRALEWLGQQMESLKQDLESSELALYKFREDNHSLSASLEERQKIIAGQLQAYSSALTDVHTRRIEMESRLTVLREIMQSKQDPLLVQASPIAADESVAMLRTKYRESAAALETVQVTYGEAHPLVKAARAQLDTLQAQLRTQVDAILGGVEADLQELTRSEQGVQAALEQVNEQGLELSLQEIQYSRLARERSSKANLYNLVMERAAQTDLTRALRVANARVVDRALRPNMPVSPRVKVTIGVGLLFGFLLGLGAAFVAAQLDNKIRSVTDVEARGVTVLGVLPATTTNAPQAGHYGRRRRGNPKPRVDDIDRDLLVHLEPRSAMAECCRTIRTNLTFQSADHPLRTLAVTSAMPREGKTTVSVSIAITLAQSGRKVLVVDTDLRKPRLHRAFKLAAGPGLTTVLAGEGVFDDVLQTTDIPGLTLMQCGPIPPNPAELLHTRRFADVVEEAKSKFDTVIFDSPPLGAVTDPAIIATQVDGVLLVVRARSTTRAGVEAAVRQLRSVSARIAGAVLNDVDLNEGSYGPYYAYYRGYYAEEPTDQPGVRAAKTSA